VGDIQSFEVNIYADVPANLADPVMPWSHPGHLLWSRVSPIGAVTVQPVIPDPPALEGWYDPVTEEFIPDDHEMYFAYNIEQIPDPFIQEKGTVYWLFICANVEVPPGGEWGWKTADTGSYPPPYTGNHFQDNAVVAGTGIAPWAALHAPITGVSLDLAFVITGRTCEERPSAIEKGSLLVFPKVEIRWNHDGWVLQDTFIDLTNDYPEDVFVKMYFVNGDPPLDADMTGYCLTDGGCQGGPNDGCYCMRDEDCWERQHPGECNWVDVMIELTANEPTYWSALTGWPKGVTPFTILDPGVPPGRPDPENPCDRVLRGYILAWAVDENGEQIAWNHLKGDALIVDYGTGSAWEYNAYAFQVHSVPRGELLWPVGSSPARLPLDGYHYDHCFGKLLLDFYSFRSSPFDTPIWGITVDTDLTLMPMVIDLRQDGYGPVTTKAVFDIWNMNEWKFSGTERCITCWDQTLLSDYDPPNHFLSENLQTNKGKARIDGIGSPVCDDEGITTVDAPLLGVAMKHLAFGTGFGSARAGMNLVGMGVEQGLIQVDTQDSPPDEKREAGVPDGEHGKRDYRGGR
jgi:hypothetical protein